jgi:hypothetical protein
MANSRLRPAPLAARGGLHRSLIAVIGSAPIDHSKTSSSKLLFDKFPGVAFLLVLLVLVLVLLVLVLLGLLQRTGFFFSLAISMPASSSSSMISSSSSSWGFAFLHLLFPFPLGTTAVIGMLLWWPLKRPFVF